jgi:hypothetical protein
MLSGPSSFCGTAHGAAHLMGAGGQKHQEVIVQQVTEAPRHALVVERFEDAVRVVALLASSARLAGGNGLLTRCVRPWGIRLW